MKRKPFIRQKVIHCGPQNQKSEFIEVDIYPYTEMSRQKARNKREVLTSPKIQNLNDRNARRYFGQLVKSNFTENDYHVVLTYHTKFRPDSIEAAEKEVANFLRRLKRKYQKAEKKFKYVFVTEFGKRGAIHHHVLLPNGISRDDIENTWTRPKRKGQPAESIGFANCRRIQMTGKGMEQLIGYLQKETQGKKRWKSSNHLIRPWASRSDGKYSRKQIDKMAQLPPDCDAVREYWERQFPKYKLYEVMNEFNTETARWSIYLKMRLRR